MRVVAINEAEAIIEPFWDGALGAYDTVVPEDVRGSVDQTWCALRVQFDSGTPGRRITMQRTCELDIRDYDTLRVFGSIPSWVRLYLHARVDDAWHEVVAGCAGSDTNDEHEGPLRGRRMTGLRLEWELVEDRPASCLIMWVGLSDLEKQAVMEARPSPYDPAWPGLLHTAEPEAAEFVPQIGIFFDASEVEGIRRKLSRGPLAESYAALRDLARKDLEIEPERHIDYLIGRPDRRWCRNRDMTKVNTTSRMERLAFVGLIEGDPRYSRMAARMALSAAHCDTWCESTMGVFPGATWHHRSFTEEIYCRACGLVLDWAGFCFTHHAQQIIRDAIIMKGLSRIESDFKRMEYIRHMNQGIVFSSGRILGALSLLPAHPRYAAVVDEAERDFHEMIDGYVHADGGTLEGMAYWAYTFGSVMPTVFALARYHGTSLEAYAPESLKRTGAFGLGMLSTTGAGTTYLPLNDAHADRSYSAGLSASFASLLPSSRWPELYRLIVTQGGDEPDLHHLIIAPEVEEPGPSALESEPPNRERMEVFPDVGQVSTHRMDAEGRSVHFHFSSGPTDSGHFHQDKGSFILEIGGEVLACDRGVTTYDHPETSLIGMASRHNLLYPEFEDGRLERQPGNVHGGVLGTPLWEGAAVLLAGDQTRAWSDGVFECNIRRVVSPAPVVFIFDDEVRLPQPRAMSFRVNTRWAVDLTGGAAVLRAQRSSIRFVPLNWSPVEITAEIEGCDSYLEPVTLLRMVSPLAVEHRLLTAMIVGEAGEITAGRDPRVAWDSGAVKLRADSNALLATIDSDAGTRAFRCAGLSWRKE